MALTPARVLMLLGGALLAGGGAAWSLAPHLPGAVAPALAAAGVVLLAAGGVTGVISSRPRAPATDPDDMSVLDEARRRELMRGTSMHLRTMGYRFSVRPDTRDTGDRRCFSAEVQGLRIGFIPAVITDVADDRQGLGFVAFVHDGRRWRGPGLPCPADQAEAVKHAAKCMGGGNEGVGE